jgi:hypothetical protein
MIGQTYLPERASIGPINWLALYYDLYLSWVDTRELGGS